MSKNAPLSNVGNANLSRRSFLFGALAASLSLAGLGTLSGCSSSGGASSNAASSTSTSGAADSGEKKTIKISAIAREEPEIVWLKGYLADKYDIEPVIFSDNVSVNESVVDGSVDLNYFQNANYLENTYNAANGTDLQAYGEGIFYMPYTITSRKYKSLDEIESGASVLIASQASGTSTELRVLEKAGLITVDPDVPLATIYDVTSNPKNLDFILIEARSRVGAFDDADLMVAESMNVVNMHRDDVKLEDALFIEDCTDRNKYEKDLVITVRKETKEENPQWLQDIDAAWHSQDFKDWLKETYGDGKIAAF